jgi:hypothetical protein
MDLTLTTERRTGVNSRCMPFYRPTEIRKFFDQVKDKVKVVKGLEKIVYSATEFSIENNNGYLLNFAKDEK